MGLELQHGVIHRSCFVKLVTPAGLACNSRNLKMNGWGVGLPTRVKCHLNSFSQCTRKMLYHPEMGYSWDVCTREMCALEQCCNIVRCVHSWDVSTREMFPLVRCVHSWDVSTREMCPLVRCVYSWDVSTREMCALGQCCTLVRCVQVSVTSHEKSMKK